MISVIHPSRGRPQQAFETARKWRDRADNNFQYLLSIDNSDIYKPEYIKSFESYGETGLMICSDNKSVIEAINLAAYEYSRGDLLIVISDDFDCPNHWDTLLLKAVRGYEDFLLKTQDGNQPTLITLPIMDRAYYNRFGYIYNPEYKHMYADTEMTEVGHILGRVIASDLLFEHKHYSIGKSQFDHIYEKNNQTYQQGEEVYNRRKAMNFGL